MNTNTDDRKTLKIGHGPLADHVRRNFGASDWVDTYPSAPGEFDSLICHLEHEPSRTWPSCRGGPCADGRRPCPTADACRVLIDGDDDGLRTAHAIVLWCGSSVLVMAVVLLIAWAL